MTHAQPMVRLRDGTVVPASSINGPLPDGATFLNSMLGMDGHGIPRDGEVVQIPLMMKDRAPAAGELYLQDGAVTLTDAERIVVDAWGAGTEWIAGLPGHDAGSAKNVISDAASGGPDGARAATDLSLRFAKMADHAHRPEAERAAYRKGAEYLGGMSRAANALADGSPGAADTGRSAYAAMCDGLTNAWRS